MAVRTVRTSPAKVGDWVAVIGGGPVGQLVLQVLRRAGMGQVAMVEPSTFRRQTATRLGADQALAPDEARKALAGGELAPLDHVFECSGYLPRSSWASTCWPPAAASAWSGCPPAPSRSTRSPPSPRRRASSPASSTWQRSSPRVLLLASGAVDVDTLTTAVVPIEWFADAFAALRQPESTMKVLIDPKQSPAGSEPTTTV